MADTSKCVYEWYLCFWVAKIGLTTGGALSFSCQIVGYRYLNLQTESVSKKMSIALSLADGVSERPKVEKHRFSKSGVFRKR